MDAAATYSEKFENTGTPTGKRLDGFFGFLRNDNNKIVVIDSDWLGPASPLTQLAVTWTDILDLPDAFEQFTSMSKRELFDFKELNHKTVHLRFQCRSGEKEIQDALSVELPALIAKINHMIHRYAKAQSD
jgi:hypothetical protein